MSETPIPDVQPGSLALLRYALSREDFTRAEVAEWTGWARTTVQARLDDLLSVKLLRELHPAQGLRGRPATRYRFNPDRGMLMVGDVGASGARLALCNLSGEIQERTELSLHIGDGPEPALAAIVDGFDSLLPADRRPGELWGVALSLPGPVEVATGRVVSPPIMHGWDQYDVPSRLQRDLGDVPVFVDNDVTAMAWGERQARFADTENLIFIKVGTGVGAGIVANGRPLRGAQGAAGDLGHTWADPSDIRDDRPLCRCGKEGCVEAYAGGWALARDLRAAGLEATSTADVLRLLGEGNAYAIKLVRDAGRILGAALAEAVSLFNPSVLVIGGELSSAGEHLLSGVRERVAARSLPLATRDLVIERTALAGDSGVLGLSNLLASRMLATAGSPEENLLSP